MRGRDLLIDAMLATTAAKPRLRRPSRQSTAHCIEDIFLDIRPAPCEADGFAVSIEDKSYGCSAKLRKLDFEVVRAGDSSAGDRKIGAEQQVERSSRKHITAQSQLEFREQLPPRHKRIVTLDFADKSILAV